MSKSETTTERMCAGAMVAAGEMPPTVCSRCGATKNELCHDFDAQEAQEAKQASGMPVMNQTTARCYIENHELHFPSGLVAELTNGHGTIGLHPDWLKDDGYNVTHNAYGNADYLTDSDLMALADMMIEGWTRFREKIRSGEMS